MLRCTIRGSDLRRRFLLDGAQIGASQRIAKISRMYNSRWRRVGAVFVRSDSEEAQTP